MAITIRDIYLIVISLALLFATIGLTPHRTNENVKVHQQPTEDLVSSAYFQQFNFKNQV